MLPCRSPDWNATCLPKRKSLEQLRREQEELARQQELWRGRWQELLGELGFPPQWDPRLATKVLSELANARLRYQSRPGPGKPDRRNDGDGGRLREASRRNSAAGWLPTWKRCLPRKRLLS